MLSSLDILENYPQLYTRKEEAIAFTVQDNGLENERVILAWTYSVFEFKPELLELSRIIKRRAVPFQNA
jgi:hypothetical protein